ncbi:MAG: hypothetical protein HYU57_00265 [Micavibrio aeruginosavorus]|nr:hypothetical protein [Micavibrio aeruginosavorus]
MKISLTTTRDFAEAVAHTNRDVHQQALDCLDRALKTCNGTVSNVDIKAAHIEVDLPGSDYNNARAFQMHMRVHPVMRGKVLLAKIVP